MVNSVNYFKVERRKLKIVLTNMGELSGICTRPTVLTLVWASGRALMSNPDVKFTFGMSC